jgi:hypothetical protein
LTVAYKHCKIDVLDLVTTPIQKEVTLGFLCAHNYPTPKVSPRKAWRKYPSKEVVSIGTEVAKYLRISWVFMRLWCHVSITTTG